MSEHMADIIARLQGEQPAAIDAYVARKLRGATNSSAELHWRALFVTALREANLWPASVRAGQRT